MGSSWRLTHRVDVDRLGGSWFGFCSVCGWFGPWRRYRWSAKRDANRHVLRDDA